MTRALSRTSVAPLRQTPPRLRQELEPKAPATRAAADDFTAFERPKVSLDGAPKPARPDLSGAKVFGRAVDPSSAHDLFWHYFGNRPSPTNNDEARALMAEMAEKLAPFGFVVEPVEHARMDKVNITSPGGKLEQVDLIYAMGGAPGEQRLQWLPSNPVGPALPGGQVDSNFVLGVLSMFSPTNAGVREAVEELKKRPGYEHVRLLEHALRLDKLDFGNGLVVDVVIGAGGDNPRWGWLPE